MYFVKECLGSQIIKIFLILSTVSKVILEGGGGGRHPTLHPFILQKCV